MPTDLPRPSQDRPLPSRGPRWTLSRCLSSLLRIGVSCWPAACSRCPRLLCHHSGLCVTFTTAYTLKLRCLPLSASLLVLGALKDLVSKSLPYPLPRQWAGPTKRNLVSQWSYVEGGQERRPGGSEPWRCLTQIHPALVLQELYSWCRTPAFRYYVSSVGISLL